MAENKYNDTYKTDKAKGLSENYRARVQQTDSDIQRQSTWQYWEAKWEDVCIARSAHTETDS